jgi:protein-L-isoaspartate(D-aspartate) O-methyltransferase
VVPLDLNGVQRSVAFERDGDHWTSRSVSLCGFIRMRGSFAGPERTYLLDPATDLTLNLPTAREVDGDALTEVLGEAPAVHPVGDIGPTPTPMQLFDGFTLWLAVHEPRWCALSEQAGADPARLADAPMRAPESVATAGVLTDDGLALIAVEDEKLTIHAHGNTAVADDLLAHVRAWADAGRPGTAGMRIDAYPAGTAGRGGDVVLEKGQCRLALSW